MSFQFIVATICISPLLCCNLTGQDFWSLLLFDPTKTYSAGEAVVISEGDAEIYTAKQSVTGVSPPNSTYWNTAAEKTSELASSPAFIAAQSELNSIRNDPNLYVSKLALAVGDLTTPVTGSPSDTDFNRTLWYEQYDEWLNNPEPYGGVETLEYIKSLVDSNSSTGEVYLGEKNITDLTPIKALVNVGGFELHENNFSDLSPLSDLVNVTGLTLHGNFNIKDLSPLSDLHLLERLSLDVNASAMNEVELTSFLSPLSKLPLKYLYLDVFHLSGEGLNLLLHPLSKINLSIGIYYSDLNDRSALSDFNTTYVDLIYSSVSEKTDLSGTGVDFYFPGSSLSHFDFLPKSDKFTFIGLWDNQIRDISPLNGVSFSNHGELILSNNQISDISPLSQIKNLELLHLGANDITDISPLSSLSSLETLFLYENNISDLSALSTLSGLQYLNLADNKISDIYALKELKNIKDLILKNNNILEVGWLQSLKQLEFLDLSGNPVTRFQKTFLEKELLQTNIIWPKEILADNNFATSNETGSSFSRLVNDGPISYEVPNHVQVEIETSFTSEHLTTHLLSSPYNSNLIPFDFLPPELNRPGSDFIKSILDGNIPDVLDDPNVNLLTFETKNGYPGIQILFEDLESWILVKLSDDITDDKSPLLLSMTDKDDGETALNIIRTIRYGDSLKSSLQYSETSMPVIPQSVDLETLHTDGPINFKHKFNSTDIYPYAEIGSNAYALYRLSSDTPYVKNKLENYVTIYSNHAFTNLDDWAASKLFAIESSSSRQLIGSEKFVTDNKKHKGIFIFEKNGDMERFWIGTDFSTNEWKSKISKTEKPESFLCLEIEGFGEDFEIYLSLAKSFYYNSNNPKQKPELTEKPFEFNYSQIELKSSANILTSTNGAVTYKLPDDREYYANPIDWDYSNPDSFDFDFDVNSFGIKLDHPPISYTSLEERAAYQLFAMKALSPDSEVWVDKFENQNGYQGIALIQDSEFYILMDMTNPEWKESIQILDIGIDAQKALSIAKIKGSVSEYNLYRNVADSMDYDSTINGNASSLNLYDATAFDIFLGNPSSTQKISDGPVSFDLPENYSFISRNFGVTELVDAMELWDASWSEYAPLVLQSFYFDSPKYLTDTDVTFFDFSKIEATFVPNLSEIGKEKPHVYFAVIGKAQKIFDSGTDIQTAIESGLLNIGADWEEQLIADYNLADIISIENGSGAPGSSFSLYLNKEPYAIFKLSEDSSAIAFVALGEDHQVGLEIAKSISWNEEMSFQTAGRIDSGVGSKLSDGLKRNKIGSTKWFESEWLGLFFESENSNWTYHAAMGWVFPFTQSEPQESAWFWKEDAGWLWTSEDTYPYIYSNTTYFWILFDETVNGGKKYYDYFDKKWRNWGNFPERTLREIEAKSVNRIIGSSQQGNLKADQIRTIIYLGL